MSRTMARRDVVSTIFVASARTLRTPHAIRRTQPAAFRWWNRSLTNRVPKEVTIQKAPDVRRESPHTSAKGFSGPRQRWLSPMPSQHVGTTHGASGRRLSGQDGEQL
jgi:hypothetical protein